jgi:hypothetical protein
MFGLVGGIMSALGVVLLAFMAFSNLLAHQALTQRQALAIFVGVLFVFTGVQLVTIGLLAEIQARTYHESQGKPVYVIRQILETETTDGQQSQASSTSNVEGRTSN